MMKRYVGKVFANFTSDVLNLLLCVCILFGAGNPQIPPKIVCAIEFNENWWINTIFPFQAKQIKVYQPERELKLQIFMNNLALQCAHIHNISLGNRLFQMNFQIAIVSKEQQLQQKTKNTSSKFFFCYVSILLRNKLNTFKLFSQFHLIFFSLVFISEVQLGHKIGLECSTTLTSCIFALVKIMVCPWAKREN